MKKGLLLFFAAFLVFGASFLTKTKACNLSSFVVVSTVQAPVGTYTITATLCLGYGRTGIVFGADGPTNVLSFAIFKNSAGDAATQAALNMFTPTLTIPFNNPPFTGPGDVGFQAGSGFGIGENDNIIYLNSNGYDMTCMASTVNCGNAGTHCQTVTFRYTGGLLPDSIRAIGVEGLAPFGGCWPNGDMVIHLGSLPVVWNQFTGVPGDGGVNLDWTTAEEHNSREFRLMRKTSLDEDFVQIGTVQSFGNTEDFTNYKFVDKNPVEGINEYQLVQVDNGGATQKSEIISVTYTPPAFMSIGNLYPNPSSDQVMVQINSDTEAEATLSLWSLSGQVMDEMKTSLLVGMNEKRLDVSTFAPGIYMLRLSSKEGILEKKVVVQ